MKLQVASSIGLFALLLAPFAAAETKPAAHPAPRPAVRPTVPTATGVARTTHPPTALHAQPHSKNQEPPPQLRLPQLPPPDAKPTTVAPVAPPPSAPPITPVTTNAKPGATTAATPPKPPCLKQPIAITRGIEEDRFSLTKCDGSAAPESVEHLSVLARSGDALKPATPIAALAKVPGDNVAPGIRRIDARLVERMQLVVDHFVKNAQTQKLHLISGYRPASAGSFHATARALDFRVDGVTNEELVAFCKTLPDTGCGYYPNSSFVHMDVREPGTGHVTWIDASGPGESPRYVPTWPPPKVIPAPSAEASAFLLELLGQAKGQTPAGTDETPADPVKAPSASLAPPPPPPPTSPLLDTP